MEMKLQSKILFCEIFLVFLHPGFIKTDSSLENIYIAGLLPVSGDHEMVSVGRGVLPAVELALEHVNSQPDILPYHQLKLTWNDSQVIIEDLLLKFWVKIGLIQADVRTIENEFE